MEIDEFLKNNRAEWVARIRAKFAPQPQSMSWQTIPDFIRVLGSFAAIDFNHMFFPKTGGHDLLSVSESYEPGCIELTSGGSPYVVKPVSVSFEYFPAYPSMSYFRMELDTLTKVREEYESSTEELTEIKPGQYVDRSHWDESTFGHDEGGNPLPLPSSARLVIRILSGAIVIFAKGSLYNVITSHYDGRHANMASAEFRKYVLMRQQRRASSNEVSGVHRLTRSGV